MKTLRYLPLLLLLAVRVALWFLFVPLSCLLLKASCHFGPLRFPFLLLTAPITLVGVLLQALVHGEERILEGNLAAAFQPRFPDSL